MAVRKSTLVIKLDGGLDKKGKAIVKNKRINKINPQAEANILNEAGKKIAGLQQLGFTEAYAVNELTLS